LYLQKHRIEAPAVEKDAPKQTITVRVKREPTKAGIDPLHKLVDRFPRDNVQNVEAAEGA
ncbi:MAG: hypothetical protein WBA12_11745, partial [Catalinimonas sp.]